jgi:hypothetical protein
MTEEEARGRALELLDPQGSPKVEFVALVAFDRDGLNAPNSASEADWPYWWRWFDSVGEPRQGHPLYLVVATGDDIQLVSLPIHHDHNVGTPVGDVTAAPTPPPRRVGLVLLFDAVTGREVAYGMLLEVGATTDDASKLEPLAAVPTVELDEVGSSALRLTPTATMTPRDDAAAARSSPTPSPTVVVPPAGAVPLAEATLTEEQSNAITVFPLRPGARWVYRFTHRADFRWRTERITAELESGWVLPDGALLWSVRTAASQTSPSHRALHPWETPMPPAGYGVFTAGEKVIAYRAGTFYENDNDRGVRSSDTDEPEIATLPPYAWWPLLQLPLDSGGPWFLGEPWNGDPEDPYGGYSVSGHMPVTVPAGTFDGCALLRLPIGAGATEWRWFCEGVGFVRQEGYGNNPSYDQLKLELLEFRPGR